MPTSISDEISWLDRLREDAGVPETVDLEGAVMIDGGVAGGDVSTNTYRKWPVPYFILNKSRRYFVADVVAYAKKRVEEAPRRIPPQRGPRKSAEAAT
jgi:hypothetical protein